MDDSESRTNHQWISKILIYCGLTTKLYQSLIWWEQRLLKQGRVFPRDFLESFKDKAIKDLSGWLDQTNILKLYLISFLFQCCDSCRDLAIDSKEIQLN